MTLHEFLARLQGVREIEPGKYAARCPAHEDRIGSLVASEGDNAIVFHCHAGCTSGQVREALALEWRELFYSTPTQKGGVVNIGGIKPTPAAAPKQARSAPATSGPQMPPNHVVQAWESGLNETLAARLFVLKGWSDRTLRRVRAGWDGVRVTFPVYDADGWMVGLVRYLPGGEPKTLAVGPRELWPAPESLPAGDVWLVEGEPDRVSGVELGLDAVAVPGIGKWREEWAARFTGRRVVVCLDCDESCCAEARAGGGILEGETGCGACGALKRRTYGGRDHAQRLVGHLRGAGVDAVAVDLFPDRMDGYDIGDALAGATKEGRVDDLRRYLLRLEDTARRAAA